MSTYEPGQDLSFLDEVHHLEGACLAKKEYVLELQEIYEKIPFGSYYFVPADFDEVGRSPFTHISRRTCQGVSYADGKYGGNDTVWTEDSSVAISWGICSGSRLHTPVVYTSLRHMNSGWIDGAEFLEYHPLRKAMAKDFKGWSNRLSEEDRNDQDGFDFQSSYGEKSPLTSLLSITTDEDLFQFVVRFLHREEPLIPGPNPMKRGIRPNAEFVRNNISDLRRLFAILSYDKFDFKD